jgi:hypothetical protein
MRVKFEATDATGKMHKRSSISHIYSHCVVIHFAAHPPSKLWSKGVAACSHAEWVGSCALAERKASRWRKDPCVEAIARSLRRGKCDAIPEGQEPRAGKLLPPTTTSKH